MEHKVTPIGDVLKTVFERLEREKTLTREDVEARWKEATGQVEAKHSRPVSLRKGVLTVYIDSSVWMQELSMRKRQILKGLKSMFGKDKISEIHFKIGEI